MDVSLCEMYVGHLSKQWALDVFSCGMARVTALRYMVARSSNKSATLYGKAASKENSTKLLIQVKRLAIQGDVVIDNLIQWKTISSKTQDVGHLKIENAAINPE